MARVDLSAYEMLALNEGLILLVDSLPDDDLEGTLGLALLHRKLELAARESVARDELARLQEGYDF